MSSRTQEIDRVAYLVTTLKRGDVTWVLTQCPPSVVRELDEALTKLFDTPEGRRT